MKARILLMLLIALLLQSCTDEQVWRFSEEIGPAHKHYKDPFGWGTVAPVKGAEGVHLSIAHATKGDIVCNQTIWLEIDGQMVRATVRSIGKYRGDVIGVSGLGITEPISDVRLWKKAEMPVMSNPKYCDPNYFKPGWLYGE